MTHGSPYPVPASRSGRLDPEPAEALAGLLGAKEPESILPPFWHWVYLLDRPTQADLGHDGHPQTTPPGAAPRRRMFAGGRLLIRSPLRLGRPARRVSLIQQVQDKTGRSGPLTFVSVRHEIWQDGALCVIDDQDLVYRPPAAEPPLSLVPPPARVAGAPQVDAAGPSVWACDPVLLFRFSALTYNAHRIHYDLDFARSEGYPGLVVHGPLQVLFMAETLRQAGHCFTDSRFDYRLVAPAFAPQLLGASIEPPKQDGATDVSVRGTDGRVTATGRLHARTNDG